MRFNLLTLAGERSLFKPATYGRWSQVIISGESILLPHQGQRKHFALTITPDTTHNQNRWVRNILKMNGVGGWDTLLTVTTKHKGAQLKPQSVFFCHILIASLFVLVAKVSVLSFISILQIWGGAKLAHTDLTFWLRLIQCLRMLKHFMTFPIIRHKKRVRHMDTDHWQFDGLWKYGTFTHIARF